ncbi:sulfatase-like hydrolase/transferase [Thermopirellula anaerolimosa]
MSRLRREWNALASVGKWTTLGLGFAGWLYAAQIGSWTSERNRYHDFWSRVDAWAIMVGVVSAAVLIATAGWALSRVKSERFKQAARFVFALVLADLVLSWLVSTFVGVGFTTKYDAVFWLGWTGIAAALFVVRDRAWRVSAVFARVMWPLPLVYLFLVLSWAPWDCDGKAQKSAQPMPATHSSPNSPRTPVYIFVFDEWSYQRSMENGRFIPELPHLAAFARQASVFHNAVSAADTTFFSLPRFLLQQSEGELGLSGGRAFWRTDSRVRPLEEMPTLLDAPARAGYQATLVGFYHPYHVLFERRGIVARGYPNDPKRPDLLGRALELGMYNLEFLTDPISRWVYRVYQAEHFSRHWRRHVATIVEDTIEVLDRNRPDTFAVFHWPLPHGPFIFDADGRYRGPYNPRFDTMYGTPDDYLRHLRLLDRRVGEIVEHLQAVGRFDDALIVFTSDHSWRRDPELPTTPNAPERRHVPLLIKFPGQTEPRESWDPIELAQLERLIFPRVAGLDIQSE